MYTHKNIGVFFDYSKRLIGVPCGEDEYGLIGLDIFFVLEPGCDDEELEAFILKLLGACYSKEYIPTEPTAIQKYTGIKSPITAVKNYGILNIDWLNGERYIFSPMKPDKQNRGGFVGAGGIEISVPINYKTGALALAFRHALKIAYEHTF